MPLEPPFPPDPRSVDAPAIDAAAFDAVAALGDDSFVAELVTAFEIQTSADLRDLSVAVANGERESIRQAAHSMRSAALNLGASRMADLSETIETSAQSAEIARLEQLAQTLAAEFDLACQDLTSRLNTSR